MDTLNLFVAAVAFCAVVYVLKVIRMKREFVRYKLRLMVAAGTMYAVVAWGMLQFGRSIVEAILAGVCAAFVVKLFFPSLKQSRRIPESIRRRVIERDLKGKPFDSRRHHIDHIVPVSKGGDHSMKNLRVLSKSENLRKGTKIPRLRDML